MAGKFIPDADSGFARMARVFADNIANDPARYLLSASDAAIITQAVNAFRDALAASLWVNTRTTITIMEKDEARAKAEQVVRKYANLIRVSEEIRQVDKQMVFITERPKRLKRRKCPKRSPYLRYVGSEDGVHILSFREEHLASSRAKPFGAARLELFVDLVPPGQPIPESPGELSGEDSVAGGRPWYLRSFTKTPMRVKFPKPKSPMIVVY